jgi:hypothetical protein
VAENTSPKSESEANPFPETTTDLESLVASWLDVMAASCGLGVGAAICPAVTCGLG